MASDEFVNMSKTKRQEGSRVPDDEFKYIVHDSNILAGILRTYVSEFAGMEIRDIKKCMDLKGGGRVLDRNSERPRVRIRYAWIRYSR